MPEKQFAVAVKALIKNPEGKFLIMRKSKEEEINPDTVDIPGGRINFGEKPETALTREVREESGLVIRIKNPTRVWDFVKDDLHLIGITFLTELASGKIKISNEHSEFYWVEKEEVLKGEFPQWLKEEFEMI